MRGYIFFYPDGFGLRMASGFWMASGLSEWFRW